MQKTFELVVECIGAPGNTFRDAEFALIMLMDCLPKCPCFLVQADGVQAKFISLKIKEEV